MKNYEWDVLSIAEDLALKLFTAHFTDLDAVYQDGLYFEAESILILRMVNIEKDEVN